MVVVYRLMDLEGWSDMIFMYIFVCMFDEVNCFLFNSYGLLLEEVCVLNLVMVDV